MEPPVIWGTKGFEFWILLSLLLLHSKCSATSRTRIGSQHHNDRRIRQFGNAKFISLETDPVWFKKAQVDLRNIGLDQNQIILMGWDANKQWYDRKQFRKLWNSS